MLSRTSSGVDRRLESPHRMRRRRGTGVRRGGAVSVAAAVVRRAQRAQGGRPSPLGGGRDRRPARSAPHSGRRAEERRQARRQQECPPRSSKKAASGRRAPPGRVCRWLRRGGLVLLRAGVGVVACPGRRRRSGTRCQRRRRPPCPSQPGEFRYDLEMSRHHVGREGFRQRAAARQRASDSLVARGMTKRPTGRPRPPAAARRPAWRRRDAPRAPLRFAQLHPKPRIFTWSSTRPR